MSHRNQIDLLTLNRSNDPHELAQIFRGWAHERSRPTVWVAALCGALALVAGLLLDY